MERIRPVQPPTIRGVVVELGRLAGFHPLKKLQLPGTKKVRQGLERLNWAIQLRDAIGARRREQASYTVAGP